ncbi:MAG: type II secretion system F family protein [Armatimonadetes bacterium]|nr:type II secretion system F family protein [Armatimonadota bacterium]
MMGLSTKNVMPVTTEELHTWARDFYNALLEPKTASFLDRFNPTIERQPNAGFRRILEAVREMVSIGLPFSTALSVYPDVFDQDFVTIIRYGEIHGELHVVLERFLDHPEDRFPRCKVPPPPSP